MIEYIDKLKSYEEPIYNLCRATCAFYLNKDKQIQKIENLINPFRVPLLNKITILDLHNFRDFLSKNFPSHLNKCVEMHTIQRGKQRGVFAGFQQSLASNI